MAEKLLTKDDIQAIVKEALGTEVAELRAEIEKGHRPSYGDGVHGMGESARIVPEEPGLRFARYIRAVAVAEMNRSAVETVLRNWGEGELADLAVAERGAFQQSQDPRITRRLKALGLDTLANGGALVPEVVSAEIIPLLRARTLVRKLGAVTGPIETYPKQTGAGTANYVGENTNASSSSQTFGQQPMSEKHLIAVTALSNSLIRRADPRVDTIVRDDLVATVALAEDLNFIRGTGSAFAPKGILNWTASGNKFTMTATPTLTTIMADLIKAIRLVDESNVAFQKPGWMISPRTRWHLFGVLDSNGHPVFQAELTAGMLLGYPIGASTQIPKNLGGGADESEVYFGEFTDCVIGEDTGMEVAAFPNGAYYDGTNVISGISQDQTVIRVSAHHDFLQRHTDTFAVVQGVTWGA